MSTPTVEAPTLFSYRELEDRNKYVLNGHFRCDQCGAQAYNRATFHNGLELFFCGHHGKKHYYSIVNHLQEWYTEEIRLEENKLIGSEN